MTQIETITSLTHLVDIFNHKLRSQLAYATEKQTAEEHKNFGPGVLNDINYPEDGSPYTSEVMVNVSNTEYLYIPPVMRRHYYWLSVQDEWKINRLFSTSLGLRYDHYSDFGGTTNPRFSFHLHPTSKLDLQLFYGTAFRSPKQGEREIRNNPTLIGNTELEPETIKTLEFGINYRITQNLLLKGNIYHFRASKLIIEKPIEATPAIRKYQNEGESDGDGAELGLKLKPINSLTLQFNTSFNRVKQMDGEIDPNMPQNMYFAGLDCEITLSLQWHIDIKRVANRKRHSSDPRPEIDDYNWATTSVNCHALDNLKLGLSIENLTDADA